MIRLLQKITASRLLPFLLGIATLPFAGAAELKPIPDKLVVLTFDDSSKSHFTVVRPILKKRGFSATFFITEGWDFATNKTDYMSWEEIAQLHKDGFEIGNHTRDHMAVSEIAVLKLSEQLLAIEERCKAHGIPSPVSFAWPGNRTTTKAFEVLREHGILWARRGGGPEFPYDEGRGFAFEPGKDHPMLLPSAGDARPVWKLGDFVRAAEQAKEGKIAILQFHGAPDTAHNWVSSDPEMFEAYINYLAENDYQVIALRDLAEFVEPEIAPADPFEIVEKRKATLKP
ncbi:MAG: peptidoglycan/xylan/chitin deacetylase (PgdA/CDA1 family) [Verrucomicrobiales bacterium]|jgi:peptidoglycan/xylan/chitin deacetylase (PgdA/CDA1 family)